MKTLKTSLEQWRVLHAVIEHGGYAQAAQALHRSQSSISYTVARLQDQLGIPLLQIEGRRAHLTEHGKAMLAASSGVLDGALKLEQMAHRFEQGWEPELRVAVDVAFPTERLLWAMQAFSRQAAHTRLQLSEVVLSGADQALLERRADVIISSRVPDGYLGDLLLDVDFIAVAHPSHALHGASHPLDERDLAQAMQIVLRDSGTIQPRDEGWLGAPWRWTVSSMQTSAEMVAAGLGFAWLPRHLIASYLDKGQMRPLPLLTGSVRRVGLYLIYAVAARQGLATALLGDLLKQSVAQPMLKEA
jgi:DNA-binding transcriptional LysR family regulator